MYNVAATWQGNELTGKIYRSIPANKEERVEVRIIIELL